MEPGPGRKNVFNHFPRFRFLVSIPDMGNLWLPWALPAALNVLRRRSVQAIYATGTPFSSHILGGILKSMTGIPLVLDYRDEWTLDPLHSLWRSSQQARFGFVERFQQRWVVNKADKVLLTTDSARSAFIQHYGNAEKFITVRNGFDPGDFEKAVEPELPRDKFHFAYCGSTLPPVARPDVFLEGLRRGVDQQASLKDRIRVSFVGQLDQQSEELITRLDLGNYVRVVGYVSHAESVGYLRRADVLLLIAKSFSSRVPGKIYEYIGARKPVLVLAPREGESVELLNRVGVGIWADPEDATSVAEKIIELEARWRHRSLANELEESAIHSFTRKYLTGRLAQVLNEVTA